MIHLYSPIHQISVLALVLIQLVPTFSNAYETRRLQLSQCLGTAYVTTVDTPESLPNLGFTPHIQCKSADESLVSISSTYAFHENEQIIRMDAVFLQLENLNVELSSIEELWIDAKDYSVNIAGIPTTKLMSLTNMNFNGILFQAPELVSIAIPLSLQSLSVVATNAQDIELQIAPGQLELQNLTLYSNPFKKFPKILYEREYKPALPEINISVLPGDLEPISNENLAVLKVNMRVDPNACIRSNDPTFLRMYCNGSEPLQPSFTGPPPIKNNKVNDEPAVSIVQSNDTASKSSTKNILADESSQMPGSSSSSINGVEVKKPITHYRLPKAVTVCIICGLLICTIMTIVIIRKMMLSRSYERADRLMYHMNSLRPTDFKTASTIIHSNTNQMYDELGSENSNHQEANARTYAPSSSQSHSMRRLSSKSYSVWKDTELLSLQLYLNDIQDIKPLASGAYSVVWLVKYNNHLYASKRLTQEWNANNVKTNYSAGPSVVSNTSVKVSSRQRVMDFIQEIKLASRLNHPNIPALFGIAWTVERDIQALFEYLENGDLRSYLKDIPKPPVWAEWKYGVALDIIRALNYVHSFDPPLVHRDLKSRNVLLSSDFCAKLSDFGIARYISMDSTMTTCVGTGKWLAPEVIAGNGDYNERCDIYAYGVVLAELDMQDLPYENLRPNITDVAILQLVSVGKIKPKLSKSCPKGIRHIAEKCLSFNPMDRPTAVEIAYQLRVIFTENVIQADNRM